MRAGVRDCVQTVTTAPTGTRRHVKRKGGMEQAESTPTYIPGPACTAAAGGACARRQWKSDYIYAGKGTFACKPRWCAVALMQQASSAMPSPALPPSRADKGEGGGVE